MEDMWDDISYSILPIMGLTFKAALGMTIALYILNQSHLLPKNISSVVSRALFWPSMPITASKRIGQWVTRIDETVVMGGAPFGFLQYPQKLHDQYGIQGVINMCEEYRGPVKQYKKLGIEELYLPTTDHFEPSREDLLSALSFIKRHEAKGKRVYVHCRAGHGRSGAVVFAWLLLKHPTADPERLNAEFRKVRNVRSTLWKQPNIRDLHRRLRKNPGAFDDIRDSFFEKEGEEDGQ
jgi:atypical dual specificity phosphatase